MLNGERIARPAVWCLFKLAIQRSGVVSGRGLPPSGGHHLEHGLNAHLLVLDFFSEHAAENIGDPLVGELDRTVQRVSLAATRTVSLPARTTWSRRSADASRRRSRSSSPSTVRPSPDNQGEKHGQAGRKNRTHHGWQRR